MHIGNNVAFTHARTQDETVKAKRLQSMGELPGLLPASSSLHGRPSIAALGSSDTVDVDDAAAPTPAVQVADTSISKSPVNASNSECSLFVGLA